MIQLQCFILGLPTNQGIEVGQFEWEIDDWKQGDYYYVLIVF